MKQSGLIIGQAKGEKWKNGPFFTSKLWDWFATIGLTRDEVYRVLAFDALINEGTLKAKKGRVPPSLPQIKSYRPTLVQAVDAQKPKLIIPVGNLAVRQVMDHPKILLEEAIGARFVLRPFGECREETVIIPLPHPSGVSLWLNAAHNKKLLAHAMVLIKREMDAWQG